MSRGTPRPGPRPNRRKIKTCRRCGNEYWGRKHGYCSLECGEAARREHLASVEITPEVIEGLRRSPLTTRGDRHHSAKSYRLVSPDGDIFRGECLQHFIRSCPELFAAEDRVERSHRGASRASVGLGQLRPGRKSRRDSWKGWTWEDDDESEKKGENT